MVKFKAPRTQRKEAWVNEVCGNMPKKPCAPEDWSQSSGLGFDGQLRPAPGYHYLPSAVCYIKLKELNLWIPIQCEGKKRHWCEKPLMILNSALWKEGSHS